MQEKWLVYFYLSSMTFYEFIVMDEMEQAEAVWEGIHIGNRQDEEHNILCYQIDSFYVEVLYHTEYNVIRRYRPFKNPE